MSAELLKLFGINNDNIEIIIIRHPQNTPIPETKVATIQPNVKNNINFVPPGTDSYGQSYTNAQSRISTDTNSYTGAQSRISHAPDNINFDFIPFNKTEQPFYIDNEPSPNGETTFAEKEYVSTQKYIKVKNDEIEGHPMSVDKFLDEIRQEEDSRQGMKRARYYEEELHQPINKKPKYDTRRIYCILCKNFTHDINRCHHVCTFASCRQVNDIHFKNNCPIVKPCCICGGYYHVGLSCYYRCKSKNCGHYKKYHNSHDC